MYKDERLALFLELKQKEAIKYNTWDKMYPASDIPPKFYGLPKSKRKNASPNISQQFWKCHL